VNQDQIEKETTAAPSGDDRIAVPLYAEEMSVIKENRETGRVRITTVTRQREELVDELLARERIEVETVAIGKPIEAIPPVRNEGDTIVVPVVEEVLVTERRLVLKEELRIRRVRTTERHQERVTLRRQEASILRLPLKAQTAEASESHTQETGI
jgi:stress response protein YsnF